MNELVKLKKYIEIKKWLDVNLEYGEWTINDDLTIDVEGNINIETFYDREIEELPDYINFGRVSGRFSIGANPFKSTKGFPKYCKSAGVRVLSSKRLEKPDWCECGSWEN